VTSQVCIDANIILTIVLGEPGRDEVENLFRSWIAADTEVLAPSLLAYEVTSVIRTKVYRNLILLEEGQLALQRAFGLPVTLLRPGKLHERAWQLAERLGRPSAYDAHYLALAETLGCDFWTADERLYNAVKDQLPWVHWIGHHIIP